MAYFRALTSQLTHIQSLLHKNDTWLILINADPDALGSAMALQRIMRKKIKKIHIARINEISRPDNLAMIRNLRIPVKIWNPEMAGLYTKFAIVDSQPHHSPLFANIDFSIIIDHHPLPVATENDNDTLNVNKIKKLSKESTFSNEQISMEEASSPTLVAKVLDTESKDKKEKNKKDKNKKQIQESQEVQESHKMQDIRPEYGATSTMLTEYLYNAHIRPGKYLATALQYGIRTDTAVFGRQSTEIDLRAYHYLSRFADQNLLMRIIRSEYLPQWLPYFTKAFTNLQPCGTGHFTYLSNVDSCDILVVIADFFLKVHGLKYIVVAGVYKKQVICIFRGNKINLGVLAQKAFSEYGSAGGHKIMARAEFPLKTLQKIHSELIFNLRKKELTPDENKLLEKFLLARLKQFGTKKMLKH